MRRKQEMKQEMNNADIVTLEKQIENKAQNKKALKFFIPMIIVAGIVGLCLGVGIIYLKEHGMEEGLSGFFHNIMFEITPWMVIGAGLLGIFLTGFNIRKAKKLYAGALSEATDGEIDEEAGERIEQILSDSFIIQSVSQILQFMFFGAFMSILLDYIWIKSPVITIATVVVFMVSIFVEIKQQQIIVDMEKLMNPSKNGSVYDKDFQKKWEDSCDELEKSIIYKSAYKAYKAGVLCCVILWIFFAVIGMLLQTGMMPVMAVSLVWLVMTLAYMKEARRLERGK